jgi:tripartite-type tricarboxylate transporter receptor subunit TctC
MVHVPYKGGSGQMVGDLLAGQVQLASIGLPPAMPHVKSGKLRPIAVTTDKRSHTLPQLPTIAEAGVKGYEASTWYGLLAPAGTPQAVITRLHDEVVRALKTPDMREKFASQGFEPAGTTPAEFAAYIKSEIAKWGKVIHDAGIKAD